MSEYTGISFILNKKAVRNQIPTTKTVLKTYQNSLCVKSKNWELFTKRTDKKKILSMLRINNKQVEKRTE